MGAPFAALRRDIPARRYGDGRSPCAPDVTAHSAGADGACELPAGAAVVGDDCDDTSAAAWPGAPETCGEGIDQDCDTLDPTCCDAGETVAGIALVEVCPGTFDMGCTAGQADCDADEAVHSVTLTTSFLVAVAEVAQEQFAARMGYDTSTFASCGATCPVETTTWHAAAAFANALSTLVGLPECYTCAGSGRSVTCEASSDPYACVGYRMPTEAEWEASARCGTDLRYAGSDVSDDVAWTSASASASCAPRRDRSGTRWARLPDRGRRKPRGRRGCRWGWLSGRAVRG